MRMRRNTVIGAPPPAVWGWAGAASYGYQKPPRHRPRTAPDICVEGATANDLLRCRLLHHHLLSADSSLDRQGSTIIRSLGIR